MPSDYSGLVQIGRPLTRREAAIARACVQLQRRRDLPSASAEESYDRWRRDAAEELGRLAPTDDELADLRLKLAALSPPEAGAPSEVAVGVLVEVISGNGAGSRGRVTHLGREREACPRGHAVGHPCRRVHLGAWWTTLCNVRPVPEVRP